MRASRTRPFPKWPRPRTSAVEAPGRGRGPCRRRVLRHEDATPTGAGRGKLQPIVSKPDAGWTRAGEETAVRDAEALAGDESSPDGSSEPATSTTSTAEEAYAESKPRPRGRRGARDRSRPSRLRRDPPDEDRHDDDHDHEVTTLDGGSEERDPPEPQGAVTRTKANRSSTSAATRWTKCRAVRTACAATTRSRKSSSAARCCWCRSSRRSAATRARR